ncbi:anti-sigma factor family protein [Leptolyngbya ohadii]|uniref:anti-sigma factor family protein n=1 Tax=Leptolyngbya ohadii TaxID=1962290 RepID=UPI00117B3383|nr:zf-HC2 domain-containing protein [Leptolyngbya ohadii]
MSNFDEFDRPTSSHPKQGHSPDPMPFVAADNLTKRDRFELLSAYLDGEVTAAERRQVEAWLKTDPQTQKLYARLLKLRQGVRTLPVPQSEQPVEQVVQQVSARLNRSPKRLIWGGLAFAALVVGSVIGTLPREFGTPQMANAPHSAEKAIPNEGLMIALDRPVIEIPKAAVSNPQSTVKPQTIQ